MEEHDLNFRFSTFRSLSYRANHVQRCKSDCSFAKPKIHLGVLLIKYTHAVRNSRKRNAENQN